MAIDVAEGKVVRLTRGEMKARTVYGDDPAATARQWEQAGARWLHVVDLDRATGSGGDNHKVVEKVIDAVGIPVEVGGGVRSVEDLRRWVESGAARVCAGTRSLDPDFLEAAVGDFADQLVVSIDSRGDRVQVEGWKTDSSRSPAEAVAQAASAGVRRIMFTDIDRDGTLSGPNLEAVERVLEQASGRMGVIASGGVNDGGDISKLAALASRGLEGVVVGRALYSGSVTLADALAAADSAKGAASKARGGAANTHAG